MRIKSAMLCSLTAFVVSLSSPLWAQPTIKTIKPAGGGDFATLQAWWDWAKTQTNADQWAECYSGGNLGTVSISGASFTPDASHYVKIYAADGNENLGVKTNGAYIQVASSGVSGIGNSVAYTQVAGLGINCGSQLGVSGILAQQPGSMLVERCYVHNLGQLGVGYNLEAPNGSVLMRNCISEVGAGNHGEIGISCGAFGGTTQSIAIYNCTVSGGSYGIKFRFGIGSNHVDATLRNCIVGNTDQADFLDESSGQATITASNNLSEDATADDFGGSGHLTNQTMTNIFTNPGGSDFSLKTGSNAIDAGTTIASLTNDIAKVTRPQGTAYDMGAFEFVIPVPPAAPSGLSATSSSATQIDLAWTDNSNNETGFKIERKTGTAGTYAQIGSVSSNVTSFSDTAVMALTEYVYRVRATNQWGNSPYSNESSATPGGVPPPTGTLAPTVAITSPVDQTSTNAAALAVQVAFTNTAGTVGTVILKRDGTEVGRTENAPGTTGGSANFNVPLATLPEGQKNFQAVAYSGPLQTGLTGTSTAVRVILDRTPPTLFATPSPQPNANGWNNSNVTVHFDASDSGSGISSVSPDVTVTNEGAGQIVTGMAADRAGNSASASVAINLDKTPPSISATVTPPPNNNGWNTTDTTVGFTATDSLSGLDSVTPPVVVTNEATGQSITGVAVDRAGNTASATAVISLDKTPPTLTGSPANGDIVNSPRPPFIIEYVDDVSGLNPPSLQVLLDGSDITSQLLRFTAGAIYAPPSDLADGAHTWQISLSDTAGNTALVSSSFVVAPGPLAQGPTLSEVNISDTKRAEALIMPDVEAIWIQGSRSDTNATVSASVNFGEPFAMNVRDGQFGYLVPLGFGTNIVVLTASKTESNANSYAYTVVRSDRYRAKLNAPTSGDFVMDGPMMGYFANGQPQTISGYVSAKKDEGLPTEEPLESVTVNGVATTLGAVDANGNVPFTTVAPVPVPTNGSFQSLNVTIVWPSTNTIPLGLLEGYVIISKHTESSGHYAVEFLGPGFGPMCSGHMWNVGPGTAFDGYEDFTFPNLIVPNYHSFGRLLGSGGCADTLSSSAITWYPAQTGETYQVMLQPSRGLTFVDVADNYTHSVRFDDQGAIISDEAVLSGRGGDGLTYSDGRFTFTAPIYYGPNTPVVFTFEGVNYAHDPYVPLDLSEVTFNGKVPTVTNNATGEVGYWIKVNGGQLYNISQGSFGWPGAVVTNIVTTNYYNGATNVFTQHTNERWLQFSGFHNGPIGITRSGKLIQGDQTAIVGQKIVLEGKIPSDITVTSETWTIPGSTKKTYVQTLDRDNNVCKGDRKDLVAADYTQNKIEFYWIDKGDQDVQLEVKYQDAKHNPKTDTVTAKFHVLRPEFKNFKGTITELNPPVARRNIGQAKYLILGELTGNLVDPKNGISLSASVTAPAGGAGQVAYTQLENTSRTRTIGGTPFLRSSAGQDVLDDALGIHPYAKDIADGATVDVPGWDSPGTLADTTAFDKVSADDKFKSYLVYRPAGTDSIWVTLGVLDWSWKASATRSSNGWAVDPGAKPDTPKDVITGASSTELPKWDKGDFQLNYQ